MEILRTLLVSELPLVRCVNYDLNAFLPCFPLAVSDSVAVTLFWRRREFNQCFSKAAETLESDDRI